MTQFTCIDCSHVIPPNEVVLRQIVHPQEPDKECMAAYHLTCFLNTLSLHAERKARRCDICELLIEPRASFVRVTRLTPQGRSSDCFHEECYDRLHPDPPMEINDSGCEPLPPSSP